MQVLIATFDKNHKLFPIASAVAEIEKEVSWVWFFDCLAKALYPMDQRNMTIVSDRQKGLHEAVANQYLPKSHCYCCRHIADNIINKFKDRSIVQQF